MTRLSEAALGQLGLVVKRQKYDRRALRPRIVHLGLGAFFRAHGMLYTEDCNGRDGDWGVVGASLQQPEQRDRLKEQDFLYTATEIGKAGRRTRVVGNLLDVLVAAENPAALVARMADAQTEIVSLTVTEKGYCHEPATGRLNFDHPDIVADLAEPHGPRSAIGFLVAALAARKALGGKPFTVMSCDNLPRNGALLAGLVRELASAQDKHLADWISENVVFPSSMVDRIVPAQTAADLAAVAQETGLDDSAAVSHEPFRQWVLQDQFRGMRPRWEEAGVQFVADVAPFEHAKLRMLNGAHSALAYLGYLAGHETVVDAVGDAPFAAYLQRLWNEEIIPTLAEPPGMALGAYAGQLLERFANPAIRHRTWQIAMDGSQKLPQRLLGTVRDNLRSSRSVTLLAIAVAAWLRYVEGVDEHGAPIDVRDPLLQLIRERMNVAGVDRVRSVLSITEIFGTDLRQNMAFTHALDSATTAIAIKGVKRTLSELCSGA
jgi:fructuronate reductase